MALFPAVRLANHLYRFGRGGHDHEGARGARGRAIVDLQTKTPSRRRRVVRYGAQWLQARRDLRLRKARTMDVLEDGGDGACASVRRYMVRRDWHGLDRHP